MVYRPGVEATLPDALSRREQDTLGDDDKLLRFRRFLEPDRTLDWPDPAGKDAVTMNTMAVNLLATQLEEGQALTTEIDGTTPEATTGSRGSAGPFQDDELNELWNATVAKDSLYSSVLRPVSSGSRTLLSEIKVKIQAGDYSVDKKGYLRYRGKL